MNEFINEVLRRYPDIRECPRYVFEFENLEGRKNELRRPHGRYWEPGGDENNELPEEQWCDIEPEELPFR